MLLMQQGAYIYARVNYFDISEEDDSILYRFFTFINLFNALKKLFKNRQNV